MSVCTARVVAVAGRSRCAPSAEASRWPFEKAKKIMAKPASKPAAKKAAPKAGAAANKSEEVRKFYRIFTDGEWGAPIWPQDTSKEVTGLKPNTTYKFHIWASLNSGTATSNTVSPAIRPVGQVDAAADENATQKREPNSRKPPIHNTTPSGKPR
jgi:hypothetical protein